MKTPKNPSQTHTYSTQCRDCEKEVSRTFHIDDLNKIPEEHKMLRCNNCETIKKAEKDHA